MTNLAKFFSMANYSVFFRNSQGGRWAWVRLGKIKCAVICVGLCGWLKLFLFCEELAFCLSFYCSFLFVVSVF